MESLFCQKSVTRLAGRNRHLYFILKAHDMTLNFAFVPEGGRLQKELQYVEAHLGKGAGATSEMIIQTPIEDSGTASILTSEALLSHLDVLQAATRVVVDHEDV